MAEEPVRHNEGEEWTDASEHEKMSVLGKKKEVEEILNVLQNLDQPQQRKTKVQVEQKEKQLCEVLGIPLDQWLPTGNCTTVISRCESYLSDTNAVLTNEENLTPSKLLAKASGGLALKGFFQGKLVEPKRKVLNPPENVTLKSTEMTLVDKTEEYLSKDQLDKFLQTLDKMGYSVAANAKVGLWGFGEEVTETPRCEQQHRPETNPAKQCTFLSRIKYTVVPIATCELEKKQLTLSAEALCEIQKLEKSVGECENVADVSKRCEEFFNAFGTHVKVGPLHFGGISKTVAAYSSETMSQTSSVRSLLRRALNAHVNADCAERALDLVGQVVTGTSQSRQGVEEQDIDPSKVDIAHSRTGGLPEVGTLSLWQSGLMIHNSTWALIDWGSDSVGIWDLLQSNNEVVLEPKIMAATLENVWQWLDEDIDDVVFKVNELANMAERWLCDVKFSQKCTIYLREITEIFHDVQNETGGQKYWFSKHGIGGPLDRFLAKLVSVEHQLPRDNLPVMRHWVRQLINCSPPDSIFRKDCLLKWAGTAQDEIDRSGDNVKTIPKLLATLRADLDVNHPPTDSASSHITGDIEARIATQLKDLLNSLSSPHHVLFLRTHLLELQFDVTQMTFNPAPSKEKLCKFVADAEVHWQEFQSRYSRGKTMEAESFLIHMLLTSCHFQKKEDGELKEKEFAEIIKDMWQVATTKMNQLLDKHATSPYNWNELTAVTKQLAGRNLSSLEKGTASLSELQNVLNYSSSNPVSSDGTKKANRKKKKAKRKPMKDSYKDLLNNLGLVQYYPDHISLQQATTVRAFLADPQKQDLPWNLIHMLMGLDNRARDNFLSEMTQEQTEDDGFKLDLGEYEDEGNEESNLPPNPMDVLLATFTCCDGILQQVLAQNLFLCKLAIPFLYPVRTPENVVFSLWALRSIIVQCRNDSGSTFETPVTDQPFPVVTFVRLGRPSVSKSKLLNDVLTGGIHETFYSSECHKRTETRKLADGTLECSWFLPAFTENDMFPSVTLFLNLRGNGSTSPKQMELVTKVSSLILVVANIENIAEPPHVHTFENICKKGKKVVLLLTSESKCPDMKRAQDEWRKCVTHIGQETLTSIQQVTTFKKAMTANDLKIKLQTMLLKLLPKTSDFSIEQMAELCEEIGFQIDENSSSCLTGKLLAQEVMKEMEGKDIVERKRDLLPLQGKTWLEYSQLLKQQYRAAVKEKSSFSQHEIQKKMLTLRKTQVDMCMNLTPFIRSFLKSVLSTNTQKDQAFYLQWIKLLLDTESRLHLPSLNRRYCEMWQEFREAKSSEDTVLLTTLRLKVNEAEQEIADASFGLENLVRELGQIYEAVHESSVKVDKKLKESLKQLPETAAKMLLAGTPLELLDGDASIVPITWIKAVLLELQNIVGDTRLLVLSVLGVQSSGKSTLLNTMFGLKFAVSAGRCTRGAFMQVIKVDRPDLPVEYIAVIDTEGLRAPELAKFKHTHDNELATLAIGLGDITFINNKGESTTEIQDVLQIAVHAFMRMKIVNKNLNMNQACIFIHQNVPAINAKEKMMQSCQKLQEQLDLMTQEAAESEHILNIKCFSQIIQFDINEHIWYFLNLWHGNPPMASVNLGYSGNVEALKQYLFDRIANKSFLKISDFTLRIQDLWNGILADDFVFSFRNSLELKAYNSMEEKYCVFQWELEKSVTNWIRQKGEIRLKKCETVPELDTVFQDLMKELTAVVGTATDRMRQSLIEFFEKDHLQEITIQWKEKKLSALKLDSNQHYRQFKEHLIKIKEVQCVSLLDMEKSKTHEQILMKKAMGFADKLKGTKVSDHELEGEFDKMWIGMMTEYTPSPLGQDMPVEEVVQTILVDLFQTDIPLLSQQLKQQPLSQPHKGESLLNSFTIQDIDIAADLSFVKTTKIGWLFQMMTNVILSKGSLEAVAQQRTFQATGRLLVSLDAQLLNLSKQETGFQRVFAEDAIRQIKCGIEHFNKQATREGFAVLSTFTVKLAVHASRHCVSVFKKMQHDYEKAHGSYAKLKAYREKAWRIFNHTMKQTTEGIIAADLLCDQLRGVVESTVSAAVPDRVVDEVVMDFSVTKHQLIQTILDDLAKKNDFGEFSQYTTDSKSFALNWIRQYTDNKMFAPQSDGRVSRYGELTKEHVIRIFRCVEKGAERAKTEACQARTHKVDVWIKAFCRSVNEIPVNSGHFQEFRRRCIEDFSQLHEIILQRIQSMRRVLIDCYSMETADTIRWGGTTPYEQVIDKLWGCPAQCPFCGEPCSLTAANHYTQTGHAHRCVQHRPVGTKGGRWVGDSPLSGQLVTDMCSYLVQSGAEFNCYYHDEQSRACLRYDPDPTHAYTDYKAFFPEWDIAPDPTNSTSKYWAWFMATYKHELANRYNAKLPSIPPAWTLFGLEDALKDLRKLH